ncbi:MAG TPA: hypothetical protein IAB32_01940 [Candidatus Scatosoma pullicola]|nr:hypothetical protein [Candidatus Scatosoma pullicola]
MKTNGNIAACLGAVLLFAAGCGGGGQSESALPVGEISGSALLSSPYVNWYGRDYADEEKGAVMFNYSAAGFETSFEGTSLSATMYGADSGEGYGNTFLSVFVDGEEKVLELSDGNGDYVLCEGLDAGRHTVKVVKRTELQFTSAGLVSLETDGHFLPAPEKPELKFEFFGDSITCGYGAVSEIGEKGFKTATEDALSTYAYLTAEHFGAQSNFICYSGWYISKSVTGTTDGDIGAVYDKYSKDNRAAWDFSSYVPDVVVVNIGANDENYINLCAAEGNTKGERMQYFDEQYTAFVKDLRAVYPEAYIFLVTGMLGESTVPNTILSIGESLAMDGDDRIFATTLYARDNPSELGADGHPSAAAHEKAAAELIGFIEECIPGL